MACISKTETNSNLTFDYSLDKYTEGDIFDWLIDVSQNEAIHVRKILCENTLDRSDEGNDSFTLGRIVTKEKIVNLCHNNGIDVISIVGAYEQKPVIIGVNLRTKYPFVTVRKSTMVDYEKLEKEIFLD